MGHNLATEYVIWDTYHFDLKQLQLLFKVAVVLLVAKVATGIGRPAPPAFSIFSWVSFDWACCGELAATAGTAKKLTDGDGAACKRASSQGSPNCSRTLWKTRPFVMDIVLGSKHQLQKVSRLEEKIWSILPVVPRKAVAEASKIGNP